MVMRGGIVRVGMAFQSKSLRGTKVGRYRSASL